VGNAVTFDLFARDRASGAFVKVGQAASKAGKEIEGMGRKSGGLSGKFAMVSRLGPRSFSAMATGAKAAGLALGGAAISAGIFGLKTASNMEQARISFTTMLGSAQKADKFLRQLQKFAASTPFEFPELQTAASSLISAGFEAKKVIPIMRTLGDVTSGMGTGSEGVKRATIALQQMSAAGRITGEDLNQLRDAGVPVFDLLAKATGKSKAEVVKLAQAGKLGKREMDQLFKALETGKGLERFNGLMEKQSKSLAGLFSTLKDNVSMSLANLVTPAIPAIKTGLTWLTDQTAAVAPKIQAVFTAAAPKIAAAFNTIASKVQAALSVIEPWVRNTLVPGVVATFGTIKAKIESALPTIDLSGLAKSFTEQAKGWGTALIAGVKTGLDTGDWSGLGETVGKGLVAAIGAAANLAKTIAGKIAELFGKVDWIGLGITVGKQAIPFVLGLAVGILNVDLFALLKGLAAHWQEAFLAVIALALTPAKIIGPVGRLLARIPLVGKFLETALLWTKGLADGLVRGVGRALAFLGRAFLDGFRTVFPRVGAAFAEWLGLLPIRIGVAALNVRAAAIRMIRSLGQAIADGAAWVVRNIGQLIAQMLRPWVNAARWLINAGRQFVSGLVGGIRSYLSLAASATAQVIRTIVSRFVGAERWLVRAGVQILQGLLQGLLQQWRNVADWLGRVGRGIVARFIGAGRWLFGIGSDIIGGLWAGFRSAMSRVGDVLKTVKDAIVGGLKTLFHIGSPSRVMAELGGHMITGLIKGMLTQSGALAQTVKSIGGTAAGLFGNILGSPGGGLVPNTNPSGVQAMVKGYAQLLYGWQGAQWNALYNLLMGESGFNPNAQNPTSSAYGIFQFLNSTWGTVGARRTSNPNDQTIAGLRYIKQNYGDPIRAYSLWSSRAPHWYGSGLSPTVFSRPTLIGVGERGPEMVSVIPRGRSGAGVTPLHVTVNLNGPILGNAKEITRQLLPAIEGQLKQRGRDVGRPNRL
jgi:tape measure domain-containing protein